MRYDFNFIDAFAVFDTLSHGFITVTELEDGLNLYGIYPSYKELDLFMKNYD